MAKSINIRVRADAAERLTLGDLAVLEQAAEGNMRWGDVISVLEKVLVDDPREVPVAALPKVVEALTRAFESLGAEGDEGKD